MNQTPSGNVHPPAKPAPVLREQRIAPLHANRLGLGVGMTGVIFYLGCMLTMATVSREKAITFFNSLLHGIDVTPILRANVSTFEVVLGIISTFVLGWFAGAMIAGFYNWGLKWQRSHG